MKSEPALPVAGRLFSTATLILLLLITSYLWLASMMQTAALVDMETTGFQADSPLVHIAVLLAAALALAYGNRRLSRLNPKSLALVVAAGAFAASMLLVLLLQVQPAGDQIEVLWGARTINKGNMDSLRQGGYLSVYPHQLGFALLVQCCNLIAGHGGDILMVQYINALSIATSMYILYRITALLFSKREVSILSLGLLVCFPQWMLYVTWYYGNMLGLALSLLAVWLELLYFRDRKWWQGLLSAFCVAFAVAAKQNFMIALVAVILLYLYDAIWGVRQLSRGPEAPAKPKRLRSLWMAFAAILAAVSIQNGLITYYEGISQSSLREGAPSSMYVAMGLRENPSLAPGWCNGYNGVESYRSFQYDPKLASEDAREKIQESLRLFADDPAYALSFFHKKIVSMWLNPTMQSFFISIEFRESNIRTIPLMSSFYSGRLNNVVVGLMNVLQTLLLAGSVAYCVCALQNGRQHDHWGSLLPALVFVGGFLFHLVWEAKGQYALLYYVFLFPYAARGLLWLGALCRRGLDAARSSRHHARPIAR